MNKLIRPHREVCVCRARSGDGYVYSIVLGEVEMVHEDWFAVDVYYPYYAYSGGAFGQGFGLMLDGYESVCRLEDFNNLLLPFEKRYGKPMIRT